MSVTVVAQYRVDADGVAIVRNAFRKMVEPTRAEAGCLAYDGYVDAADDCLVVLVERYADQSAFQAHLESAHFETSCARQSCPDSLTGSGSTSCHSATASRRR